MVASISNALHTIFARLERQLLQVAEEMPAEEFSFRPSHDVRTFGEQLRHIATVQWVVAAALLGEPTPVQVGDGDNGPLTLTSKAKIMEYASESCAYFRRAIESVDERNAIDLLPHPYAPQIKRERLAILSGYISHGWEHYGQMVVYQRMKGIVPPPSRST